MPNIIQKSVDLIPMKKEDQSQTGVHNMSTTGHCFCTIDAS